MGWIPAEVRQWNCVIRLWCRLKTMDVNRLNYKVYKWADSMKTRTKNWYFRFQKHLQSISCSHFLNNDYSTRHMITTCEKQYLNVFIDNWKNELSRERARRGNGQNKLCTYRTYKSSFETETYVKVLMPFAWRSSIAKFRTGVAPLRLETGRYEGLAVNQRTCFNCNENVESEQYVLLKCPLYEDLQQTIFNQTFNINTGFYSLSDEEKLIFLFTSKDMIKTVAKTCKDVLDRRRRFLYK